jgi:hypothetical protein
MGKLQEGYLASDWVNTIHLELLLLTLASCTAGSTFWDYFNCMQSLNSLPINTTSFQKEKDFHQKVEAGLDAELTQKCPDKGCQDIAPLHSWVQLVKTIDDAHHADQICTHQVTAELLREHQSGCNENDEPYNSYAKH